MLAPVPATDAARRVALLVLERCLQDAQVELLPGTADHVAFRCRDDGWELDVVIELSRLQEELPGWRKSATAALGDADPDVDSRVAALMSIHVGEALWACGPDDDPSAPRRRQLLLP